MRINKSGFFSVDKPKEAQEEVDERNERKTKLNSLCCSAKSDDINDYLGKYPMDINYDQGTPLILAIRSVQVCPSPTLEKYLNTLQVLVDFGADVHINEEAPLRWAMKVNSHAAVRFFISMDTTFKVNSEDVDEYIGRNSGNSDLDEQLMHLLGDAKVQSPSLGGH